MRQINFHLPRINRKATREAVDEKLNKLRICLLQIPVKKHPKVTSSLQLVPIKPDGQFHSSTEDAALKNLDEEVERTLFTEHMTETINRLPEPERAVIVKEYMDNSYRYNYEIYNDLGVSKAQYYKIKGRAFYNLALMLGVEVYIYQKKVSNS